MKFLVIITFYFFAALFFAPDAYTDTVAPFEQCEVNAPDTYIKKFKDTKENEFNLSKNKDGCEIEIKSSDSGAMLVRKVNIESKKYKYINFKLKITNLIEKENLKEKKGDDAPARVYVFFEYEKEKAGFWEKAYRKYSGNEYDGKSIVYTWSGNTKKGEAFENPYSDQFIEIVVESGAANLNKYVSFKRNVYEDFKKHFGYEPPAHISSIAVMTDTDNTHESATGYFSGIFFSEN